MYWRLWLNRIVVTAMAVLTDALAINIALYMTYIWVRPLNIEGQAQFDNTPVSAIWMFLAILNVVMFVTFVTTGLYALPRGVSRIDESFKILFSVTIGVLLTYIINLLAPQFGWIDVPLDSVLLLGGLVTLISMAVFFRIVYRTTLSHLRRRGFDQRRILIIGALDPGQLVYRSISRDASLGYRVMGFASDAVPEGATVANSLVLCNFAGIGTTIRNHGIDLVIVALSGRASHELFDIIMSAEDEHVEVKLYPDAFTLITNNVISDNDVAGLPLLNVRNGALANPLNQLLKRLFDLAFASALLILLSPLMLLIALLIKLESKGPAFFIQPRVGIDGKPFPTIKFRTMRVDAPNLANWTTQDDPRKTGIWRNFAQNIT